MENQYPSNFSILKKFSIFLNFRSNSPYYSFFKSQNTLKQLLHKYDCSILTFLYFPQFSRNNEPSTWELQILAPPNDLIATKELEFELGGLQANTTYKIKISVMMHDIDNAPSSSILTIKTLAAGNYFWIRSTKVTKNKMFVYNYNNFQQHLHQLYHRSYQWSPSSE